MKDAAGAKDSVSYTIRYPDGTIRKACTDKKTCEMSVGDTVKIGGLKVSHDGCKKG